jgi:hypothetical protein
MFSDLKEKTGRSLVEWSDLIRCERSSKPKVWLERADERDRN